MNCSVTTYTINDGHGQTWFSYSIIVNGNPLATPLTAERLYKTEKLALVKGVRFLNSKVKNAGISSL